MRYLFLCCVLLLAACTSSPATTSPNNATSVPATALPSDPTPTREGDNEVTGDLGSGFGFDTTELEDGFVAVINGAEVAVINGEGYYACENGMYALRPHASGLQQVTLLLPATITAGTYPLGEVGSGGASAMVSFSDNRVFAGGISGSVTLASVATAPDQLVSGSFQFSATNGNTTISASGDFHFQSAVDVVYCG